MSYRYGSFKWNPVLVLIAVNVLLLFPATFSRSFVVFAGLIPALVVERPWTLLTAMFIHSGLWHLLGNMITLYFFGTFLLRLVGDKKFLIVYLLGGLAGNVLYVALAYLGASTGIGFLGSPMSIVVGASGAIFAVGGALAVMQPRVQVYVFPIPAPIPLWVAVIGGFFIMSFLSNVAWQAHLGGLLVGLTAGYLHKSRSRYFTF